MPGTFHPSLQGLRWIRNLRVDGPARMYEAEAVDGWLRAMVSRDPTTHGDLWHISVSHWSRDRKPDRCPTWDELKHAKFSLMPADVPMVLIFPRRAAPYVNEHPT